MTQNHTKFVSIVLSGTIFILIVIVALYNKESVKEVISKTDPLWVLGGALCYCCNYFFRSYRLWHYTLKSGALFPTYLKITSIHGVNSYFLPMRSGDLTLPLLLRLHAGIPWSKGSRILVRARMLDIFSLGFLLFLANVFTEATIDFLLRVIFVTIGLGLIVFPYFAVFVTRSEKFQKIKLVRRIFGEGRATYPGSAETLISLLIWFWTGSTLFCVIRSLDIPLSFLDVWFLAAIQLPLQLLPVQGVANTGNHEAGWLAGLSMLGIHVDLALPLALSSHVILICYVLLLGIISLLLPSTQWAESQSIISKTE